VQIEEKFFLIERSATIFFLVKIASAFC